MAEFRDVIYGFIQVREHELAIINSEPFQRLRNIKQLAMTYYVYPGAEHTRFEHSLGVMHLVTRAFNAAIQDCPELFPIEKKEQYEQILRLVALVHDIGHAPFSHASEALFHAGMEHEDYTVKIVLETEIAGIINQIGQEFAENYGQEYRITPELICNIYMGRDFGPNSEYSFLKSFMDSELDCDKMDYLLRDSYYCGVKYGMYDVERLISSFTVYCINEVPRLAIRSGGVQAFEEFVLARYFMFIQVYFHKTRRYFDLMLGRALKMILPDGIYPVDLKEYLAWDDCRVIQLLKENRDKDEACGNIIRRYVYKRVFCTKPHPSEADIREFKRNFLDLKNKLGAEKFIIDDSAGKMPHKIPRRVEIENEKAIIIYDRATNRTTTISEESEIIKSLTEKINIMSIYCHPDFIEQALELLRSYN